MSIQLKVRKTIEGKTLQVFFLDTQRIDSIAKKRKVLGGEYLHDRRGILIGREYFTYTKSPFGELIQTIPEDFVRDLKNLSYIKQAGLMDSVDEFKVGSRFIRIEKSIESIKPLRLRPKDFYFKILEAKSLYFEIQKYKADYLDSIAGKIFGKRVNIPADLNFTKALLWLQKKIVKSDVIHEEDAWGLGKPLRPLLFKLKTFSFKTFVVRIEEAERDIYKKVNYLEVALALLTCQSSLEKASKDFLKGEKGEKGERDIFYKPKSPWSEDGVEQVKGNQMQYTRKVLKIRRNIEKKIDPLITQKRLGVTLSRIARQKRDQIVNKYQVY